MKKLKVIVSMLLATAMVGMMAGCNGNTSTSGSSSASGTDASGTASASGSGSGATAAGDALKICIVTSSGVDDGSFGEDCYNGILEFIEEHPESTVTHVKEPDMSKMIQAVSDVIADYDVMVLPGYQFANVGDIAAENPDCKIILIDTALTDAEGNEIEAPNVYAMTFAEQEGGFLAGIAAALETKTNKVAVVNGMPFPSNVNYQYGFESGVNYAKAKYGSAAELVELPSYAGKDVNGNDVGGNYIGGFADEATGKVVGAALLAEGADILFVAAGASGNGVFTAVKEASNAYAIGCDADQYDDGVNGSSNIILTSALKVMHTNVYKQLNAIVDGTFAGQNVVLTAADDSINLVTAEGRHQLSEDTIAKVQEAYALVKDGTVVPASNFNGHTPEDFPGLK